MKARKLDLRSYTMMNGQDYPIRDAVVSVLLSPELRLTGMQLLTNNRLATNILGVAADFVLLEQADYAVLADAVGNLHGFSREDVGFVDRVLNAPEVEVAEKA